MRLYLLLVVLPSVYSVTYLYMLSLYPMEGAWYGGVAIKAAAEIALEHINKMENLLVGYKLNQIWNDTKCHAGTGIDRMYQNLYNPPMKIIIYGAVCSFVSEATAQASHYWNLVEISFGSVSPALSDKTRFPRFFRANPPESEINPARMELFKKFDWSRIATIHESYERHSRPIEDLLSRLRADKMTIVRSEIVTKESKTQIRNLKESDARIIVGSFYEPFAGKVYCEAYKYGLYGPKVVYLLNGYYESKWWTKAVNRDDVDCTKEQLAQVVEGAFYVSRVLVNPTDEVTISGIRASEFIEMFKNRTDNKPLYGAKFATLSYDTVWSIALALNATQAELKATGSNLTLEDFSYTDDTVGSLIFNNMKKVSFIGTGGQLAFDEKGDPIGMYTVNRIQNGEDTIVGMFNPKLEPGFQIDWLPGAIAWKNNKIPRDSILTIVEVHHLSLSLYMCVCCISGVGALLSVCFLVFNFYFRGVRDVKMSSPRLNNVTLAGCILLYMTPFLDNISAVPNPNFCTAKGFMLVLGFSLAFGALFMKTWRVHVIFTNAAAKKKIVKDTHLLGMVGVLVAINMAVLLTWAFVDPIAVISIDLTPEIHDEEDRIIQGVVRLCESPNQMYFMATLFALQGILMLLGAFLAWETRKVKVDGLNDSKMIGMSVYNVLVLSLLGVTVSMALKFQVNLNYALTSLVVILATTVTQCLIFVPKIISVKSGGNQVDDAGNVGTMTGRTATGAGTLMTSSAVTAQRLILLEKTVQEKNKEIEKLKTKLEDCYSKLEETYSKLEEANSKLKEFYKKQEEQK